MKWQCWMQFEIEVRENVDWQWNQKLVWWVLKMDEGDIGQGMHQKVGEWYEQTLGKRIHLCSQQTYEKNLIIIRKMHIKTTMRYHLTSVGMVITKKLGNNRCWRRCGETGTLLHCWWECKLVQTLWKTVWQFLKDVEPEIPFDPAIHYWVYTPKIINHSTMRTHPHMFIAALFTIAKTWNQPKCPSMIDWIKKMWHVYTMEYYTATKEDGFMSFAGTWMKLEAIILSKLIQEQKTKHRMFSLISGSWTMRTHEHREGNMTYLGLSGAEG